MSEHDPEKARKFAIQPTPGCYCSVCRRARECQENGAPDGREQSGRAQRNADILGWADHGSDVPSEGRKFGHLRPNEAADRREREERGLKELPAAYRPIIGPAPQLTYGNRDAAMAYLYKIKQAIDIGGWTRNEWRRLHALRVKWEARATGKDPRFDEVGNKRGWLTPDQQARVRQKKLIAEMMATLGKSSRGD